MNGIPEAVLKRYGVRAVIFAVFFGLTVWGLTHWTAAPGSNVSILWGLTSYTKGGASTPEASAERSSHKIRKGSMEGREYLTARPADILNGIKKLTSSTLEANEYQKKYFSDKWIHLEGPIHDKTGLSDISSIVFLVDGISTSFLLREDQLSKLNQYQPGDEISVEGLFAHASKENGVEFWEAEILK